MNVFAILISASLAATPPLLVSTDELTTLNDACIVDARNAEDFAAEHIPGAISLYSDSLSEKRGDVQGLLKPMDQLCRLVGEAGVDPAKHVVVCSDMANPEKRTSATRVFWIFQYMGFPRVSILDGGIGKWKAEGRAITTGGASPNKVEIAGLKVRPDLMVGHADVTKMLQDKTGVVADMRPASYFTGCKFKEYVAKEGHITGARCLPNEDLFVEPNFVFKPVDKLRDVYGKKGITQDTHVITYCNGGQAATAGYFGALLIGNNNAAVYDGSMAEWSRLKDAPISMKPDLP